MATLVGYNGAVKISTNLVAEIDEFQLNVGPNMVDSASFGDSWEEKTTTLRKWTGSFKGRFDNTDTNGHMALQTAVLAGTSVALKLYVDATHYYSGTAFVELGHTQNVTGLADASYTFTGTGALTYT